MYRIYVKYKDEVHMRVVCEETSVEFELSDHFKFKAKNFQFHPKFKARIWDGSIRLYNRSTKELYLGLLPDLFKFAKERNYGLEIDPEILNLEQGTKPDITEFLKSITKFEHRDYQIDAVKEAIEKERLLLLSPTASGKSLIIYSILRYFDVPSLLIVPTINLVGQMRTDFKDYANGTEYNVDSNTHEIFSGKEKETNKQITISTWQSLAKIPKEYFSKFKLVIVDECHLAQATSLKNILEKMTETKYRFGTTGTLSGMVTDKMVVSGLLGQVFDVTTTKKLMDQGHLATLAVNCVILKYTEEERKAAKKFAYVDEVDFILSHEKRNKFLTNLVLSLEQNTMLLFNFVERHGKVLQEMIETKLKSINSNRKVFFIYGKTDAEARNDARAIVEKETNAIIIASAGVFSTGVNVKNLTNIVFAHSGKSRVRTLQSIGRVLRIGDVNYAKLYDVADDLHWKSHMNYGLKHLTERMKMYNEQEFSLKMIPLELEKKTLKKE